MNQLPFGSVCVQELSFYAYCFFECSASCKKNKYLYHLHGPEPRFCCWSRIQILNLVKDRAGVLTSSDPAFYVRSVSHLHFGLIAAGLLRSQKGACHYV